MKRGILALAIASIMVASPAMAQKKKKGAPTALELQQLQSRDIEGSKEMVFGAVMTILQDSGYRIQAADKDSGLITGISSTKSKLTWSPFVGIGKSKKSPVVSAFVESRSPTITNVRLSFVMAKVKSNLYGSQPQDEEPIYDTVTYQSAFEKLNQAVFIRQSMMAPSATPVAAALPAATPAGAEVTTTTAVTVPVATTPK
jgi:hypothetical protein